MLYVVLVVLALAAGVVLYEKFHKPVEDKVGKALDVVKSDVAKVKDEVAEVKQAADDVKKDLSK